MEAVWALVQTSQGGEDEKSRYAGDLQDPLVYKLLPPLARAKWLNNIGLGAHVGLIQAAWWDETRAGNQLRQAWDLQRCIRSKELQAQILDWKFNLQIQALTLQGVTKLWLIC